MLVCLISQGAGPKPLPIQESYEICGSQANQSQAREAHRPAASHLCNCRWSTQAIDELIQEVCRQIQRMDPCQQLSLDAHRLWLSFRSCKHVSGWSLFLIAVYRRFNTETRHMHPAGNCVWTRQQCSRQFKDECIGFSSLHSIVNEQPTDL